MLVRISRIEVVGVEEGRVNTNRVHPRSARHADVVEGVAEVGRLGWRGGVTECGKPAAERRWIRFLLNRVIAIDRRADQVGGLWR